MVIFSQVQYRPETTIAIMMQITIMTVSSGGIPKIASPAVIPINSVTSVSQFTRVRSHKENQPQNDPNAEKIASA